MAGEIKRVFSQPSRCELVESLEEVVIDGKLKLECYLIDCPAENTLLEDIRRVIDTQLDSAGKD